MWTTGGGRDKRVQCPGNTIAWLDGIKKDGKHIWWETKSGVYKAEFMYFHTLLSCLLLNVFI